MRYEGEPNPVTGERRLYEAWPPLELVVSKCPPHVFVRYYPLDDDGGRIPGEFYRCDECDEPGFRIPSVPRFLTNALWNGAHR